jgi:hypothetical protein
MMQEYCLFSRRKCQLKKMPRKISGQNIIFKMLNVKTHPYRSVRFAV